MYPSIREGELVTVEPVVASDVTLGDIVLYRSERGLIAHRVVEIASRDSRVFRLQGDASLSCDEPVEAHRILGRVVGVQRNGRSVVLASRGAKLWHKARRLASRVKGWICEGGIGSRLDFKAGLEPLTIVPDQLR